MSPVFFHSISCGENGIAHEITAFQENDVYTVTSICPTTGRQHTRFFDTLREIALWHYAEEGYVILDDNYPCEREVKVLYDPPSDDEIARTLREMGITAPKLRPRLLTTEWHTPRATLNTILWTV